MDDGNTAELKTVRGRVRYCCVLFVHCEKIRTCKLRGDTMHAGGNCDKNTMAHGTCTQSQSTNQESRSRCGKFKNPPCVCPDINFPSCLKTVMQIKMLQKGWRRVNVAPLVLSSHLLRVDEDHPSSPLHESVPRVRNANSPVYRETAIAAHTIFNLTGGRLYGVFVLGTVEK